MPKDRYLNDLKDKEFYPDPEQQHIVERLEELHTTLMQRIEDDADQSISSRITGIFSLNKSGSPACKGLYIWGSVGRGKTYLMDIFYDCLPVEKKLRLHFHRFMQGVHQQLNKVRDEENPLDIVAGHFRKHAVVLCLDELYVSDIGDAMILAGLLDALFKQGVTLITTSNCDPDSLYKDGLQRQRFLPAIELLKENTQVAELGGNTDHRLQFLEHADIYHCPLDEHADAVMHNNFLHVSPEAGTVEEILSIEGRSIKTIRCSDGVVWFDFYELCDGPRSASDYIEIARCYNTVLISNIPELTNKDDIARRFVTAIDEFYDRCVNIVVSAETAVHELYKGEKLAFEFKRTVSRLNEMRSHDYLARPHKSL